MRPASSTQTYRLHRCWPFSYQAVPGLNAGTAAVAFEVLALENEGWDRDPAVTEPQEPQFGE